MNINQPTQKFHDIKELAHALNCSNVWILQCIKTAQIRGVKCGSRWKIPDDEFQALCQSGSIPPKPPKKYPPVKKIVVPEDMRDEILGHTQDYKPPFTPTDNKENVDKKETPRKTNPYWPLPFSLED